MKFVRYGIVAVTLFATCTASGDLRFRSAFSPISQVTRHDSATMERRAYAIADKLLVNFIDTRPLAFIVAGNAGLRNSEVVAGFVSRMANKGGRLQSNGAEFRINAVSKFSRSTEGSKARRLGMTVTIRAVRPVAVGSQVLMSANGSGDCSELLLWLPNCESLERDLLGRLLYDLK